MHFSTCSWKASQPANTIMALSPADTINECMPAVNIFSSMPLHTDPAPPWHKCYIPFACLHCPGFHDSLSLLLPILAIIPPSIITGMEPLSRVTTRPPVPTISVDGAQSTVHPLVQLQLNVLGARWNQVSSAMDKTKACPLNSFGDRCQTGTRWGKLWRHTVC